MDRRRDAARAIVSDPETRRAVGLASAVMAANFAGLAFTAIFSHWLGGTRYGSLSALVSTFIILMVPGSALQTTVAREVSRAVAAGDPHAGASVRRWLRNLALGAIVVAAASVLLRHVLADVIGVGEVPWAAAATLPSGALWLMLSVERGALQGFHRYRAVGLSMVAEQSSRVAFAIVLVAGGLGVSGAFLATPLSLLAVGLALALPLRAQLPAPAEAARREEPVRSLLARAGGPVAALALVAWLQDGHVIVVKHIASGSRAGAWAAAAVAAKAIMWIAVGLALYVVPEAARRASTGRDARGVLVRTIAMVAALAVPMVLVYAAGGHALLHAVFGLTGASHALAWLGLSMSTLACSYLAVQYQLALHRTGFIALLVVAAIAQPLALLAVGPHLTTLATVMLAVQATLAVALLALAARPAAAVARPARAPEVEVPAAFTEA